MNLGFIEQFVDNYEFLCSLVIDTPKWHSKGVY